MGHYGDCKDIRYIFTSYSWFPRLPEFDLFLAEIDHKDHDEPCDCYRYQKLLERRNIVSGIDLKDPSKAELYAQLFNKAKHDLTVQQMDPDALLEHIKLLEHGLEKLIFEKRAQIQGSRDLLEDMLKAETKAKRDAIREKDKTIKYRLTGNEKDAKEKQEQKQNKLSADDQKIQDMMLQYKLDKKTSKMIHGFMKLGITLENALSMAGVKVAK